MGLLADPEHSWQQGFKASLDQLERDRRAVPAEHAADVDHHLHRRLDGVRDGVGGEDIKLPAPVDAPGAAQRKRGRTAQAGTLNQRLEPSRDYPRGTQCCPRSRR